MIPVPEKIKRKDAKAQRKKKKNLNALFCVLCASVFPTILKHRGTENTERTTPLRLCVFASLRLIFFRHGHENQCYDFFLISAIRPSRGWSEVLICTFDSL
jgi:hypothetical protein